MCLRRSPSVPSSFTAIAQIRRLGLARRGFFIGRKAQAAEVVDHSGDFFALAVDALHGVGLVKIIVQGQPFIHICDGRLSFGR